MAFKRQGYSGVEEQVDTKYRSARASLRPLDVGALGAYRINALTGSLAATIAAGAFLFSLRNAGSNKLVIHSISISAYNLSTITTSVPMAVEAAIARTFTTDFTTAATAVTPSKAMASHATSGAVAKIATTTTMSGQTLTMDAAGIGMATGMSGTTALQQIFAMTEIYRPVVGVEHPMIVGANEGLIIRPTSVGPATGTWNLGVQIAWSEVSSYDDALAA